MKNLKIAILGVCLFSFHSTLFSQKVMVSPEIRGVAESIAAKTADGYILEAQGPATPLLPALPFITKVNKNLEMTAFFDSRGILKKRNYSFVSSLYIQDRIYLVFLVQNEKPITFDVRVIELNSSTLAAVGDEKVLLTGSGYGSSVIFKPVNSLSGMFGIQVWADEKSDDTKNSKVSFYVYSKDFKQVALLQGGLFGDYGKSDKSQENPQKFFFGDVGVDTYVASDNYFTRINFLWKTMNKGEDKDVVSLLLFRKLKQDETGEVKSVNLEEFQMTTVSTYYKADSNELLVLGARKGDTPVKDGVSSKGVQIVCLDASTLAVKNSYFLPYSQDVIKLVSGFWNENPLVGNQLNDPVSFVNVKFAEDGTAYFVWQLVRDDSYSKMVYTDRRGNSTSAFQSRQNPNIGSEEVVRKSYGPILVFALNNKFEMKWQNCIPHWVVESSNTSKFSPFLKLINQSLHVFYNENPDMLKGGMVDYSRKSKGDLLAQTDPVCMVFSPDGKMTGKIIADDKVAGKTYLTNKSNEDIFENNEVLFILTSFGLMPTAKLMRVTY